MATGVLPFPLPPSPPPFFFGLFPFKTWQKPNSRLQIQASSVVVLYRALNKNIAARENNSHSPPFNFQVLLCLLGQNAHSCSPEERVISSRGEDLLGTDNVMLNFFFISYQA